MDREKKIALIEITTYHEECLFSQLQFLKGVGYDITLITHPKNSQNTPYYGISNDKVKFFDPKSSSFLIRRIKNWIGLYRFLVKSGIEQIIFNTASSNKEVIALTKFLPKKIQCFGIIHNLKKLNSSYSQKIISQRIKKYYVLNDYLEHSIEIENRDIKLFSFYPIFFPSYTPSKIINKNKDIWICIPGELNYNRRDYLMVLSALESLNRPPNLKILILGKLNADREDTKDFLHMVNSFKLGSHIITFDGFISNEAFHTFLKESDFIMAPVSLREKNYLKFKITGAYNLAFAYKKPLICPEELSAIPDLKHNSLFYSDKNSLSLLFSKICNEEVNLTQLYKEEKWNFIYQQKKYINLLASY